MAEGDTEGLVEGGVDPLETASLDPEPETGTTTQTQEQESDWKSEVTSLRSAVQEQGIQIMNLLGQIQRQPPAAAPQAPSGQPQPTPAELWRLAQTYPELGPQVLQRSMEEPLTQRFNQLETKILGTLERQSAASQLSASLEKNYADDIRAPQKSRIIPGMAQAKNFLNALVPPEQRQGELYDALAYHVAAGMNPREVAVREVSRSKAQAEARANARLRAGAIGGAGGGTGAAPVKWQPDEEVMQRLGLDPKDEKVKARLIKNQDTERMPVWGNFQAGGA